MPPTTPITESGADQSENPCYLEWSGISYLGDLKGFEFLGEVLRNMTIATLRLG
jgi:hypothetical protein